MEDAFKVEIISPEKIKFSENATSVTFPSYEGDMSVLKDHISIITFLRPGIIKVEKNNNIEQFFVQDGTIEFFNNSLTVLSSSVINIKELTKDIINKINKETEKKLQDNNINDQDRYVLNHKLETLKAISI
jgi:F-type H+-transporting ATPase subunit epsilon